MANRDEILRELKVEEICHPLADGANPEDVSVNFGILKYNQSNTFTDPQDIPDLGYVQYLISQGIGIPSTSFGSTFYINQADIVDYTIDLSLDTNIPNAVFPLCSAWVDDIPYGQCLFNPLTRILSGLPETSAGQIVKITAIWSNSLTPP